MSRLSLALVAAFILAACGSTPIPAASEPPSDEPPLDPAVLGLTCGDGHSFHPALLGSPGHAESDPDRAAAALRLEVLASPPELRLPRNGWVRIVQLAETVRFIAPARDGEGWVVVGLVLRGERWTSDISGDCQPEVVLPQGVGRAEWRLDPAFPRPAAGDRQIHVLINERACANGQSPQGRVLRPIVSPGQTAMTISILVTTIGGDCPGNPDFAMTVDLPEPIGERPLLDGAVYPPRDVTKPSSG